MLYPVDHELSLTIRAMPLSSAAASHSDEEYIGYCVDVYESERKFPLGGFGEKRLPGDPPRFANYLFNVNRPLDQVTSELPLQCTWLTDWKVIVDKGTDKDGWMYAKDFKDPPSGCQPKDVGGSARIRKRLHRRVFQVMEKFDEEHVLFPPLFRSVIMDQVLGDSDITADLIKEGERAGRPPTIATRSARGYSQGSTISGHPLCFLYIRDEDAPRCMNSKCAKPFTVVRRRHHCMSCGRIYCGDCAPKREEYNFTRVCSLCLEVEHVRILEFNQLSHLVEATVNLESGTREAIQETERSEVAALEERELLARIHQLNAEDEMLLRTDHEVKEEKTNRLLDVWEARRVKGARGGSSTVTIVEIMGLSKLPPSTWAEIRHLSNPTSTHRSEPLAHTPKYKFTAYTLVADDREPFEVTMHTKGSLLTKDKQIAQSSFYTNDGGVLRRPVQREVLPNGCYVERGDVDLEMKTPTGQPLGCSLLISWKIEFRDPEIDHVSFCPDCHHMIELCQCESDTKKQRDEALRLVALKEERDIYMARERRREQVNRERLAQGLPPLTPSRSMAKFKKLTAEAELKLQRRYFLGWGMVLRDRLLAKEKREREAAAAEKRQREKEEQRRMDQVAVDMLNRQGAKVLGLAAMVGLRKGSKPPPIEAPQQEPAAAPTLPNPVSPTPRPTLEPVVDDDVHPAISKKDEPRSRGKEGERKGRRRGQKKVEDGSQCCAVQ